MGNKYSGFVVYHGPAFALFAVLATLFLWDVLVLDYSLGAFDIILNQSSWKGEFPVHGIHQPILSDSPTAHYPQREFEWGHVKLLSNVEFNPYMFTGMPWSAQGLGGFITSIPQLFLDIGNAIDWSTWIRLICAGFFMYLLVLELGLSRMAGIFAGILWTYSLHQIVWLEFPQHLATQLWIPLVFLFNIRLLRDGMEALSVVGLLSVNVLFFTSGYMQIVLYTYITVGFFNTFYVLTHVGMGNSRRDIARWVGVHAVYVGAVLLCSAGLYAEVHFISEGLRGAQDWRGRVDPPAFSPAELAGLIKDFFPKVDEVTHMLAPNYYGGFWSGRYEFERGNIVESSRYFGILGIILAVTALVSAWRIRHFRMIAAFAAVMAVVFSMIYRNDITISALRLIPFADKGSYSRFITILTFIGCVLAAYGFRCALGRQYKWLLAALAILCGYVLAAWIRMDGFAVQKLWYPALIILVFLGAVALKRIIGFEWKWVGWLVIVISAADLMVSGYGFNTRMENEKLFPRKNTIRYLLNDPEPYRVAVISDDPLYHPNVLSYYDIPVVEGYLTVLPVDYAKYMDELFRDVHITRNGIMFLFKPNVAALRLMNVKYVLSDKPLDRRYDSLERVLDSNNHSIFRVENALPRVFCASDVIYEDDGEEEERERYADIIDDYSEPIVLGGEGRQTYTGRCEVTRLNVYTHGVEAEVVSDTERYLAVPYSYNSNWHASVNGEPAELVKANGYHMALRIPAGQSRVEIQYRNAWSMISAWVFLASALGLLIFAWRRRDNAGIPRLLLTGLAVVVVFKSALSLPGVRNDEIPERAAPEKSLRVVNQGETRGERVSYGERISAGNPGDYPLHIASEGLTQLSLLAGTFHQPSLQHPVTVRLLDESGRVLVERMVSGENVVNNRWFTINFPPLEKRTELRVQVSTDDPEVSRSFVLWFDANGELCVMSGYAIGSS